MSRIEKFVERFACERDNFVERFTFSVDVEVSKNSDDVVSNNSAEACDRLVAWVLYRRYCRFCW